MASSIVKNDARQKALEIARRLERERSKRKLTQAEFAEAAGLSQASYSDWTRGGVPLAWITLRRLVEKLDLDINQLLTGKKNGQRK